MTRLLPALALCTFATAATAHTGVTNPAVLARMEAMSAIAAEVKALTAMARGEVAFDASEVARAMEAIATTGGQVPVLFEKPESDPASEALPTIWTSYPEFTRRASAMIAAARTGAGVTDAAALHDALGALAETCRSCHASFKSP